MRVFTMLALAAALVGGALGLTNSASATPLSAAPAGVAEASTPLVSQVRHLRYRYYRPRYVYRYYRPRYRYHYYRPRYRYYRPRYHFYRVYRPRYRYYRRW